MQYGADTHFSGYLKDSRHFRVIIAHMFAVVIALVLVFMSNPAAVAHEVRPAIADFLVKDGNSYELRIQTNLEAMLTGIGAEHDDTDEADVAPQYNELRALPAEDLAEQFEAFEPGFREAFNLFFDGERSMPDTIAVEIPPVGDMDLARDSVIVVAGPLPPDATSLVWAWPEAYGTSVIRTEGEGEEEGYSAYLLAGEVSEPIALTGTDPRTILQVIGDYIVIGFQHIIPKGLDHILFVVGLFLLSTKLSALIWQISAFTLAHTVTLALGILGFVTISPAIVEPLIALSIAYVAVENILTDRLHRWRPVIVFAFGLLHGLGFASVLGEIGLSTTHFVAGLIAFNVGVEMGQLAVIVMCFALAGYWFGEKPWYRRVIVVPVSLLISLIALYWVWERVFAA